jgi:hypothetical protein
VTGPVSTVLLAATAGLLVWLAVLLARPPASARLVAAGLAPVPSASAPAAGRRTRRRGGGETSRSGPVIRPPPAGRTAPVARSGLRWSAVVGPASAGCAAWALLGGLPGLLVGLATVAWLGRRAVVRVRRPDPAAAAEVRRVLPFAEGLLAACLAAGVPPATAVAVVAGAAPEPVASLLAPVAAELALGATPRRAWGDRLSDPSTGPMAAALVRAAETGAPAAAALRAHADDLLRQRRSSAAAAVAALEVRVALPLGLCFLPAFVLAGIVPTVWSLVVPLLSAP